MLISAQMGGTNLEMFRFGVYVFVPIAFFYYFNLPSFYNKHIKPDLVSLFASKPWGFNDTIFPNFGYRFKPRRPTGLGR